MPKENVYCEANRDVEDPRLSWRAEVQWTNGSTNLDETGFVMLGTVNPKSQFRWSMVEKPTGMTGEDIESERNFDGWFISLDRSGINRLIRALRRARDQAYGADA